MSGVGGIRGCGNGVAYPRPGVHRKPIGLSGIMLVGIFLLIRRYSGVGVASALPDRGYATACEAHEFIMHNWQVVELASVSRCRKVSTKSCDEA